MKKALTIVLLLMSMITFVSADETGGKLGISIKAGNSIYFGDFDNGKAGLYYEGGIHWWVTDVIGLSANYNRPYLWVDKENPAEEFFKAQMDNYAFFARIKLLPSSSLNPYLTAGYEFYKSDPQHLNDDPIQNVDTEGTAIPAGLGLEYYLNETWALNFEALVHYTLDDIVDTKELGSKNDTWVTWSAGISLNFGKAKDSDKDGIPDKHDADPFKAEDLDGFEDDDGKPEADNDMDGVLDMDDKAPLDPEDRDGFQDEDGVPDPDNDNDGILDSNDKAPNEAEDIDGFQDEDGAPDPDNDNDGILDADDKCPDQAETKNDFEDEDGCPDKKPEIQVAKGSAIVLDGVNFASGSSQLTQNSYTILGKVLRTLTDYPELEVEVRGYTDNTGSYSGNVKISKKRAQAVKDYLVRNGIEPRRVKAVGFGPEDPIAPNNTRDGRAKNRRIEFFRIK